MQHKKFTFVKVTKYISTLPRDFDYFKEKNMQLHNLTSALYWLTCLLPYIENTRAPLTARGTRKLMFSANKTPFLKHALCVCQQLFGQITKRHYVGVCSYLLRVFALRRECVGICLATWRASFTTSVCRLLALFSCSIKLLNRRTDVSRVPPKAVRNIFTFISFSLAYIKRRRVLAVHDTRTGTAVHVSFARCVVRFFIWRFSFRLSRGWPPRPTQQHSPNRPTRYVARQTATKLYFFFLTITRAHSVTRLYVL